MERHQPALDAGPLDGVARKSAGGARVREPRSGSGISARHRAVCRRFGRTGVKPTHPELLDWLAVSFEEHGWDLKWLNKQILMSQAYRQSSARFRNIWPPIGRQAAVAESAAAPGSRDDPRFDAEGEPADERPDVRQAGADQARS